MHAIDLLLGALACWLAWEIGSRAYVVGLRCKRYRALMQQRRIRHTARTRSESSLANEDLQTGRRIMDDFGAKPVPQPGSMIYVQDVDSFTVICGDINGTHIAYRKIGLQ